MKIFNNFNKPLTIVAISIGNSYVYRSSFFMRLIVLSISLAAQFFFWMAAFSNNSEIASYNFGEFFSYLFVANLIYELLIPNNVMVSDQIREGEISQYLVLPYEFMNFIYWKLLGDRISFLVNNIIPIIAGFFLLQLTSNIDLHISFLGSGYLLFYIIGGLTIHFFIDFSIGLLAFWFEKSDFLFIVKEIIFRILAGLWFPFEILPKSLQTSFDWLPFQFLGYTPAKVFLNPEIASWWNFFLLIAWVLVFYVLNQVVWKLGIKKYEAFGA
ncbi:ABC transporter permease [Candidatus Protochlamydia sp. W-9]|uniref:ABC transporter permease n=1 Tax=Candidatus Protochlamydia sp. W-9 TaxID=1785087 RepID=UPI00096A9C80|nr:ABC-2 family transporter protein [Candidatus Protochlamydia sp. W-9]